MAWTLLQAWAKTEVGANQTTASKAFASTPTTGNLMVAFVLYANALSTDCHATTADGNSVSFTNTPSSPSNARPATAGQIYMSYLQVPASANGTITATFDSTGAGGVATLWVAEYAPSSGTNGGADADANGTGASGTSINTPTLTVNQANDLCIAAALSDHQVSTVDSPWTQRVAGTGVNQFSEGIGDILAQGSNVAVAMTQNITSGWDSIAASFKFTAAAGGTRLSCRALLGIGR